MKPGSHRVAFGSFAAAVALARAPKKSIVAFEMKRAGKMPIATLKATVVVTFGSPKSEQFLGAAPGTCQATQGTEAAQAASQAAAAVAMLALVLTVITGAGSRSVPVAMRRSSHCCEPAVEPGKHCEAELDPIAAVRPLKGQAKHGAEEALATE